MAAESYYKLVSGSTNPTTDWTSQVVLEKDDDGNVMKFVGVDAPQQLNESDIKRVRDLGYDVEKLSKSQAEEVAPSHATEVGATDTAAGAPSLGTAGKSQTEEVK